jgi:hypothetical protein
MCVDQNATPWDGSNSARFAMFRILSIFTKFGTFRFTALGHQILKKKGMGMAGILRILYTFSGMRI